MGNACGAGSASTGSIQGILVLKQALDAQKLQGQAAVQLIQSAQPVRGAAEPGKGALVDKTA